MNSVVITICVGILIIALILGVLKVVASVIFQVGRRIELMEKQCNQNVRIINELVDLRQSIFDVAAIEREAQNNEKET
jgi:hypothetical protein